jgi:hypothetical protein
MEGRAPSRPSADHRWRDELRLVRFMSGPDRAGPSVPSADRTEPVPPFRQRTGQSRSPRFMCGAGEEAFDFRGSVDGCRGVVYPFEVINRVVLAEKLDGLPVDDPGAVANRRELRWFNSYLGTHTWFRQTVLPELNRGDRVLEIGAGEGHLVSHLAACADDRDIAPTAWAALDAKPVFKGHSAVEFVAEDLLQFDGYPDTPVIFGNMILHQFEAEALACLGRLWRDHARLLVFQEPARSRLHHALCSIATLPMSHVSRHDAGVSIRAGFRSSELPDALGLHRNDWDLRVRTTLRGAYRMTARRK